MALIRIDKFLADNIDLTRREVKRLLHAGKIAVNGTVCRAADEKIDPGCGSVTVDGEPVELRGSIYIMLHKPAGVLSAVRDDTHETVLDILEKPYCSLPLFPVGRLDIDTEGLLLITDDGKLTHRLISPKSNVRKTYYARLSHPCGADYRERLAAGIALGDGTVCLPAEFRNSDTEENACWLTICEGKYHQVKRMFAALGNHVDYLRRTEIGGLALDPALAPGQMRLLTPEEVALLRDC